MAEGASSSPLYLEKCDDDIDLLSEMLSKHSDASTDDGLNSSGKLLDDNMDELSNYLCGKRHLEAELAQCVSDHDPFMSPTASAREARSVTSTARGGHTSLITGGDSFVKAEDGNTVQPGLATLTTGDSNLKCGDGNTVQPGFTSLITRDNSSVKGEGRKTVQPFTSLITGDNISVEVQSGHTKLFTVGNSNAKVADEKTVQPTKSVMVIVPPSESNVNKNALAARENRKRKKQYIQQLEENVNKLETENAKLSTKIISKEETIDYLKEQVKYLQSVIENQTTLSALLNNIENTSGVQLKSSWSTRRKLTEVGPENCDEKTTQSENSDENQENKTSSRRSKRKCEFESENVDSSKRVNSEKFSRLRPREGLCSERKDTNEGSSGGVCLHVSGSEVSLEFCVKCSKMASTGQVLNDHTKKSRTKSPRLRKVQHKD